ncbi:hypothetical protein SAMN05892883_1063 [Jatrophihabitans sp. GAS493]|uniref:DUF4190 domain-containing protein n=1 Tax=Jatrophihabitans sp. GAS493 TaxID=1907575 RepID=UPI000BB78A8C|nr:DUF4190 domain-containing protein [Jatrophihabitans sp. GAS493]SOD71557.1 hypothetical protein SAMN05892883_1063 [Jatrophihabitans sp. GAS493]
MSTPGNVDPFDPNYGPPASGPVTPGPVAHGPVTPGSTVPAYGPPPPYPPGVRYPPGAAYPPPPYGAYPRPVPQSNGMAIVGLVFGIVSIPGAIFSVFDLFALVPAFVFSIIGLRRSKQNGTGRGLAIGGIVTAILGTLAMAAVTVAAVVVISDQHRCASDFGRGSDSYYNCVDN